MIIETCTDSGLRVVVDEVPGAPVSAVYLWVGVGSADERQEEHGAAHFVGHMLFKGTERHNPGEIASLIEGLGGDMNAYTSHDQTVYYATVLNAHWALAMEVLSDMALNSCFEDEEIERERSVILEEIRGDAEDPDRTLSDAVYSKIWKTHPYGRPVIGSRKSVDGMSPSRLRRFWKRWYRPSNMVLSVSGDVSSAEVLQVAQEWFGGNFKKVGRPARPMERPQLRPRTVFLERGFKEPLVELSFPGVDIAHEDAAALDVLGVALGSGNAGILQADLKLERGLVTGAWAAACSFKDGGLFSVGCSPLVGRTQEATSRLWEVLEQVRVRGVEPGAVARARTQILSGRLFGRESVDERAHEAGWYALFTGDPRGAEAYDRAIAAVTAQKVREVAARTLVSQRSVSGLLSPKNEWTSAGFQASRPAVPMVSGAASTDRVRREVLSCGATVLIESDPKTPVASVRVLGLGGQLIERPATAGWTTAWESCVVRGVGQWDAKALADQVTNLGGNLTSWASRSMAGVGIDFPVEQLIDGLGFLDAALLKPRFEPRDIDQVREAILEEERLLPDSPDRVAWRKLTSTLLAPHPFSLPPQGDAESLGRLDSARLERLHRSLMAPENLVVGVVGDVDPDRILERLVPMLEALKSGPSLLKKRRDPRWPGKDRKILMRAGREQAQVLVGWRGCRFLDEEYAAMNIAEELLAGQGGRLFMELREKHSLAYAVSADHIPGWDPGMFAVSVATEPGRVEEAASRLRAEMETLAQTPPEASEIQRARLQVRGSRARRSQRASSRAYRLAFLERIGLPHPEAEAMVMSQLEAVDAEAVSAAVRCRLEEGSVEVRVLPE
ncbi:MAG: pitrilysin family protein [Myxococcota bacterium]|nr:pitrilysin family protein [Myxococcota bacterium]